jgi:hypothetical protein
MNKSKNTFIYFFSTAIIIFILVCPISLQAIENISSPTLSKSTALKLTNMEQKIKKLEVSLEKLKIEMEEYTADRKQSSRFLKKGLSYKINYSEFSSSEIKYLIRNPDSHLNGSEIWTHIGCSFGNGNIDNTIVFRLFRSRSVIKNKISFTEFIQPNFDFPKKIGSLYYGNIIEFWLTQNFTLSSALYFGGKYNENDNFVFKTGIEFSAGLYF